MKAAQRAGRGDETKSLLLGTGRHVFAQAGFAGASVRRITREAGTNLGAITYHFGSKRGLYEAVLADVLTPLVDRVGEAAARPGRPIDRLGAVVAVFFDYLAANPDLPRLMLQEVAAGRPAPEAVVAIIQRNAMYITGILKEGWADGSLRRGHPLLTTLSVVSQPVYMTLMAPLIRQVGGVDLRDPETRRDAAAHVMAFVGSGLTSHGSETES
jgi:AcrR family transcriptional regulator